MEKSNGKLLILLSLLPLVVYPISLYASLAFGLTILFVTIFVYKDSLVTNKVVEHTLILGLVVAIRAAFSFLIQIFDYFGRLSATYFASGFSRFLSGFDNIINALLLIMVLGLTVLAVICLIAKKDVPFFSWLSKKVLSTNGARKAPGYEETENKEDKE